MLSLGTMRSFLQLSILLPNMTYSRSLSKQIVPNAKTRLTSPNKKHPLSPPNSLDIRELSRRAAFISQINIRTSNA